MSALVAAHLIGAPMTPTPDQLKAWREACEGAAFPWRFEDTADYAEVFDADGENIALTTRPDRVRLAEALPALLDEVEALSARVEGLEGVVIEAAIQFDRYTELHRAKGTPEGDEKAAVNAAFADRLRQALLPTPTTGVDNG